ncbi:MAG: GDP-mannose 4,6-dehydratase [Pirellulaceae bacterium]|nr:GDP-mannose 4,6-dehydratase [Pirellulaceae bacterium]
MPQTALITGITGQDGSYLAELLLAEGYVVHGLVRRNSNIVRSRLDHLTSDERIYNESLFLHYGDLDDTTTIRRLIMKAKPDEVYHLAGQSHVGASFEIPETTCEFTAMGTLRLLEILRDCDPLPKFAHASSSEIFGTPTSQPQNEDTPMRPMTPYGVAKAFATQMVRVYREKFDLFACNLICYNHESPRRGESFVTRKITRSAARIRAGKQHDLMLGNLDSQRDWGYAPDYVRGFRAALSHKEPKDFVLATGILHRVSDWLEISFGHLGLDWREHVKFDPRFARSVDPVSLVGDATTAQRDLGWKPQIGFEEMVKQMVEADCQREDN